jgi:lipid-A-disaccharide synthase
MSRPLTVMLVAAEASGDALGAKLARVLRDGSGADKVRFVGVGGAKMAAEGVQSPFDIAQLSILGIVESLKAYPRAMARLKDTLALAAREKPDVAVLIDSWGFNIRLAKALRKQARPAAGQVRRPPGLGLSTGAGPGLAKAVDLLLSIQPMDKPFFDAADLPSVFVGNSALAHDFSQGRSGAAARGHRRRPTSRSCWCCPAADRPRSNASCRPFEDAVRRLKAERPDLPSSCPPPRRWRSRQGPRRRPGPSAPTSSRTRR